MLESPVRVALLARPGDARDQLRRALAELGAQLVAEGDPAELDPGTVASEKPTVVLVSLEPAVEESLERFDDLLAAPGIEVMYDDAEVTRGLDGWDLARWARHLAAKLVGSDLLPPAPSDADHLPVVDLSMEPGAPRTPAQEMDHEKLEDYAAESLDLSEWVPTNPSLAAEPVPAAPEPAAAPEPEPEASIDLDLGDLEQALGRVDAPVEASRAPEPALEDLEFDASSFDIDLSALPDENAPMPTLDEADSLSLTDDAGQEAPLLADIELDGGPVNFSSFSDDDAAHPDSVDDDVAALAAQLEAFEAQDQRPEAQEPDFATDFGHLDDVPAAEAPAAPAPTRAPATGGSMFASLELVPMDGAEAAPSPPPPPAEAPVVSFKPSAAGAALSLVDEASAEGVGQHRGASAGVLLVLAGLGGPDAVRQLLSALPPSLPVPVLLYQHLDTGKHDRLVGQLAKASRLPLDLAVEGQLAHPGRVAVLQPGTGVSHRDNRFEFTVNGGLADVVAALPAADSVVLVLSGADPSVVPAVLALKDAGAVVLAQDPGTCFDAVAAEQVIAAGAVPAGHADLARLTIDCWN
ncbi:chemotaxis protein CheB [Arenimonas sp.]|uniref:chemotaxis protein CheB n=1 Tax=Arenimonas sp. TaxID=1872635 RepID=UPI002E345F74|nr:chemotaxis protein CheB [Arenimonas sp.]HEX4854432.1 chemotaxis protein CheB [Arenimonas sp.]